MNNYTLNLEVRFNDARINRVGYGIGISTIKHCLFLLMVMFVLLAVVSPAESEAADNGHSTFTLWQLPSQTPAQMMSYVIQTVHKKVIVIDGGREGDAEFLAEFLKGLGNRVSAWFITHPHDDHFCALAAILQNPQGLRIKNIYGSLPDAAWMEQWGNPGEKACFKQFSQALEKARRKVKDLSLGRKLKIDGIRIEILSVKNPEIIRNPINNSSLVLRMADAEKSVLFLGDLGMEGGEKLLKSRLADKLPSDYVQMAHHGQNGVGEVFYQHVRPTYCLWPTPKWLWNNDNGGGKGSGRWRTLEVRTWMEKMPIKKHYVMCEGLCEIK